MMNIIIMKDLSNLPDPTTINSNDYTDLTDLSIEAIGGKKSLVGDEELYLCVLSKFFGPSTYYKLLLATTNIPLIEEP